MKRCVQINVEDKDFVDNNHIDRVMYEGIWLQHMVETFDEGNKVVRV